MQIMGHHPETDSETVGMGPSNQIFNKPPSAIPMQAKVGQLLSEGPLAETSAS